MELELFTASHISLFLRLIEVRCGLIRLYF